MYLVAHPDRGGRKVELCEHKLINICRGVDVPYLQINEAPCDQFRSEVALADTILKSLILILSSSGQPLPFAIQYCNTPLLPFNSIVMGSFALVVTMKHCVWACIAHYQPEIWTGCPPTLCTFPKHPLRNLLWVQRVCQTSCTLARTLLDRHSSYFCWWLWQQAFLHTSRTIFQIWHHLWEGDLVCLVVEFQVVPLLQVRW